MTRELMPALTELEEQLERDRDAGTLAFFRGIVAAIRAAREPEDLAGPFLELPRTAFQGFRLIASAATLVDAVLERAQSIALTLSADARTEH